jgi:hypothetical protein
VVIGVDGCFRGAEIINRGPRYTFLLRRDVFIASDYATITLRKSKTDYFRKGVNIYIYPNSSDTCPFMWLKLAMKLAPNHSPNSPAFQLPNGSPIFYRILQSFLQTIASSCGLHPPDVSTRSMRIGSAEPLHYLKWASQLTSSKTLDEGNLTLS